MLKNYFCIKKSWFKHHSPARTDETRPTKGDALREGDIVIYEWPKRNTGGGSDAITREDARVAYAAIIQDLVMMDLWKEPVDFEDALKHPEKMNALQDICSRLLAGTITLNNYINQ